MQPNLLQTLTPIVSFIVGLIGGYKFLRERIAEETTTTITITQIQEKIEATKGECSQALETLKGQWWSDEGRLSGRLDKLEVQLDNIERTQNALDKELLQIRLMQGK